MSVEIKELHIKASVSGDSHNAGNRINAAQIRREILEECRRMIREAFSRRKER